MNFITSSIITLLLIPSISLADIGPDTPPQHFKDFKYPPSFVKVVPSSEIHVPAEIKASLADNMKQMKTKGYYDSRAPEIQTLLSMKGKNVVALQNHNLASLSDPKDTHMKSQISQVGLAFNYPGISSVKSQNVIGYAGGGMWIENKGWTGVKEFFNDDELGVCSFTLFNLALSHGNTTIGEDSVNYKVNRKPGTTEVYGSNVAGFNYNVSWFDNTYSHELDCANISYDHTTLDKMITFANVLDKDLSKKLKS